jgi:hypothetical protein
MAAPAPESTPRSRTARAKRAAPINPNCPPRMVTHTPTGRVTNWSTLFRRNPRDFVPYFRPDSDDELYYQVSRRRYEAKMAMRNGDPMASGRDSVFLEGDDFEPNDI